MEGIQDRLLTSFNWWNSVGLILLCGGTGVKKKNIYDSRNKNAFLEDNGFDDISNWYNRRNISLRLIFTWAYKNIGISKDDTFYTRYTKDYGAERR